MAVKTQRMKLLMRYINLLPTRKMILVNYSKSFFFFYRFRSINSMTSITLLTELVPSLPPNIHF